MSVGMIKLFHSLPSEYEEGSNILNTIFIYSTTKQRTSFEIKTKI